MEKPSEAEPSLTESEQVMVVKTRCKGHEFMGVEIGVGNVRRYFPKQIEAIELELDHLHIQCGLKPGFWNGDTEINDPRLSAWLQSKNFHGRPGDAPVPLALIPDGNNRFRLRPIAPCQQTPRVKPSLNPVTVV